MFSLKSELDWSRVRLRWDLDKNLGCDGNGSAELGRRDAAPGAMGKKKKLGTRANRSFKYFDSRHQ